MKINSISLNIKSNNNFNKISFEGYKKASKVDSFEKEKFFSEKDLKEELMQTFIFERKQEHTIVYDYEKGEVIGRFAGDATSCLLKIPLVSQLTKKIAVYHTHPNSYKSKQEKFFPLSAQDLILMNSFPCVKKIVAYGENGEESCLEKGRNYKKLNKTQIKHLDYMLIHELVEVLDKETKEKFEKAQKEFLSNPKNSKEEQIFIFKVLNETLKSPKGAIATDNFWRKNANKFNLRYTSDI